jgi:hypothetical protein
VGSLLSEIEAGGVGNGLVLRLEIEVGGVGNGLVLRLDNDCVVMTDDKLVVAGVDVVATDDKFVVAGVDVVAREDWDEVDVLEVVELAGLNSLEAPSAGGDCSFLSRSPIWTENAPQTCTTSMK